jgi:YtcA family
MSDRKLESTNLRLDYVIGSLPAFFIVGCNPVISIAGAEFPIWTLCLFGGILVSLSLRPVFVATGIDEWMTPRLVTYSCLALAFGFLCWLVLWQ